MLKICLVYWSRCRNSLAPTSIIVAILNAIHMNADKALYNIYVYICIYIDIYICIYIYNEQLAWVLKVYNAILCSYTIYMLHHAKASHCKKVACNSLIIQLRACMYTFVPAFLDIYIIYIYIISIYLYILYIIYMHIYINIYNYTYILLCPCKLRHCVNYSAMNHNYTKQQNHAIAAIHVE